MKGALSYNENKVKQGTAEIIAASGFACDLENLGFSQKLKRFEELIGNSSKVSNNTLHISLNFSPGEDLNTETLQNIARDYMTKIGFSDQPFLVYRHDDAAHPHIHIVTTPIKQTGKSINIHNLAKKMSEPARKTIELEYGLVIAESRKKEQTLPLQPIPLKAAYYGQSETKRTISNIVQEVVSRYKFTSLDELNAVLRQYNVVADRGGINSHMYQKGGLVYSIIDKDGYKTGIPIKASSIYTSPTLSALGKKFEQNRVTRPAFQRNVQAKIFSVLNRSNSSNLFMEKLKEKKIGCSVLYERNGNIKDISFVDHNTKTVFSCGDLGINVNELLNQINYQSKKSHSNTVTESSAGNDHSGMLSLKDTASFDLLKTLLTTESHQPDLSPEFLKKRKKKRKK